MVALYSKFPAESVSEKKIKIGQDLTKLLPKFGGLLFWHKVHGAKQVDAQR